MLIDSFREKITVPVINGPHLLFFYQMFGVLSIEFLCYITSALLLHIIALLMWQFQNNEYHNRTPFHTNYTSTGGFDGLTVYHFHQLSFLLSTVPNNK